MKREEAIEQIKSHISYAEFCVRHWHNDKDVEKAYDDIEAFRMAIEALSEPKKIIGIDIPYGSDKGIATIFKGNEKMVLEEVKEIMSVVRCKDCKYQNECEEIVLFDINDDEVMGHRVHWCSYGRRE